jgi:hypothetical protein
MVVTTKTGPKDTCLGHLVGLYIYIFVLLLLTHLGTNYHPKRARDTSKCVLSPVKFFNSKIRI